MALDSIQLCRAALLKLGAAPISAFNEGTLEATVAGELYPIVRDGLLTSYYWSFARAQRALNQLTAAPAADFAHAYQLPADFLRAERLSRTGGSSHLATYEITEDRLHCDADKVTLTYTYQAPESRFPALFQTALIARLTAEFCLPITESLSRQQALSRISEMETRKARLADSQQDTPGGIQEYPLLSVRG